MENPMKWEFWASRQHRVTEWKEEDKIKIESRCSRESLEIWLGFAALEIEQVTIVLCAHQLQTFIMYLLDAVGHVRPG